MSRFVIAATLLFFAAVSGFYLFYLGSKPSCPVYTNCTYQVFSNTSYTLLVNGTYQCHYQFCAGSCPVDGEACLPTEDVDAMCGWYVQCRRGVRIAIFVIFTLFSVFAVVTAGLVLWRGLKMSTPTHMYYSDEP